MAFLLGSDYLDARLQPFARLRVPQALLEDLILSAIVKERLTLMAERWKATSGKVVFCFLGPYGVGKRTTAEALCRKLGLRLLIIDCERLLETRPEDFDGAVRLAGREAVLQRAAIYFDGFQSFLADDKRSQRNCVLGLLQERQGLTFIAGTTWEPAGTLSGLPLVQLQFSHPSYADRGKLWTRSLAGPLHAKSIPPPLLIAFGSAVARFETPQLPH